MPRIATLTLPADELTIPEVIAYLESLLGASAMDYATPIKITTSRSYELHDEREPHVEITVRQDEPAEPALDPAALTPDPDDDLMALAKAVGVARKAA